MRPMPGMVSFSVAGPPMLSQLRLQTTLLNYDNEIKMTEKKKAPGRGTETKRTRRDRGEMEEIIFKLFERQPNWSLRNLIQETDQPE
ncbi:general transcription factor iif subunit 2-like, partial [Trifolium medium]|nr:general transcription factor iif subunit 2-like [Trifolium medium]